jgi:hypothetical protein
MLCIYLEGKYCEAKGTPDNEFSPTADELKELCQNDDFYKCPRYKAYVEYLRAKA